MDKLIIKCITVFCIILIISTSSCSINKQNTYAKSLADMVKQGNDPQKAACAVHFGESSTEMIICNSIANKGK